jgi:HK97 family phage portal protein
MNLMQRIVGAVSYLRGKVPEMPGFSYYHRAPGDFKRRPPSPAELIVYYRDIAYACANLNARGLAKVPLRLYVRTATGQRKSRLKGRKVGPESVRHLRAKAYMMDENVEEVTEHPFLDLLDKPCSQDDLACTGRFGFLETTQLYLETVGRSYWWVVKDATGLPSALWWLSAQDVKPVRELGSSKIVDYYEYTAGRLIQKFKPEEIVPFSTVDLTDPYTGGFSPLEAAFSRAGILERYTGLTESLLRNRARPDLSLSPKDPMGVLSEINRKYLEEQWEQRFGDAGAGRILVSTQPLDVNPLAFPGKDVAELTEQEMTIATIARCFDVPLSMLHKDANRASAQEGRAQHANDALMPRCKRMEDILNSRVMPLYDESKRLFLCFDGPVPCDPDIQSQIHERYVKGQVLTPNEVRREIGYDDIEGGDEVVKPPKPELKPGESGKPKPKSAAADSIARMKPAELAQFLAAKEAIRSGKPIMGAAWRY